MDALCARHSAWATWRASQWGVSLRLTRVGSGEVVGEVTAPSLLAAVRRHEVILGDAQGRGPVPRGAIEETRDHPAIARWAYRTKRAGIAAESVREYLDAAALDPDGIAVRVWITTDAADAPRDQEDV